MEEWESAQAEEKAEGRWTVVVTEARCLEVKEVVQVQGGRLEAGKVAEDRGRCFLTEHDDEHGHGTGRPAVGKRRYCCFSRPPGSHQGAHGTPWPVGSTCLRRFVMQVLRENQNQ